MNKEKLIKIADYLDSVGREEYANLIDEVLQNAEDLSAETIEVPVDEYDELVSVLNSLKDSLN